jgi:hypothetical protein
MLFVLLPGGCKELLYYDGGYFNSLSFSRAVFFTVGSMHANVHLPYF